MRADSGGGQLELLPARAPGVRRGCLLLDDLAGFEHAAPDGELVELIAQLGLLEPIVVRSRSEGRHGIIEGRRRAKAIQLLAEQGRWPTPARVDALIVRDVADGGEIVSAGMTLALHASRSSSPASELRAIEQILAYGGEEAQTISQIAAQAGMPVQTVRRRLRLCNLIPALRTAFDDGEITVGVAEASARLTATQQAAIEQTHIATGGLTLGDVREIARQRTSQALAALPAGIFAEREAPWRLTVRGHLQAALDAIPASDADGQLTAAITAAIAHTDGMAAATPVGGA